MKFISRNNYYARKKNILNRRALKRLNYFKKEFFLYERKHNIVSKINNRSVVVNYPVLVNLSEHYIELSGFVEVVASLNIKRDNGSVNLKTPSRLRWESRCNIYIKIYNKEKFRKLYYELKKQTI